MFGLQPTFRLILATVTVALLLNTSQVLAHEDGARGLGSIRMHHQHIRDVQDAATSLEKREVFSNPPYMERDDDRRLAERLANMYGDESLADQIEHYLNSQDDTTSSDSTTLSNSTTRTRTRTRTRNRTRTGKETHTRHRNRTSTLTTSSDPTAQPTAPQANYGIQDNLLSDSDDSSSTSVEPTTAPTSSSISSTEEDTTEDDSTASSSSDQDNSTTSSNAEQDDSSDSTTSSSGKDDSTATTSEKDDSSNNNGGLLRLGNLSNPSNSDDSTSEQPTATEKPASNNSSDNSDSSSSSKNVSGNVSESPTPSDTDFYSYATPAATSTRKHRHQQHTPVASLLDPVLGGADDGDPTLSDSVAKPTRTYGLDDPQPTDDWNSVDSETTTYTSRRARPTSSVDDSTWTWTTSHTRHHTWTDEPSWTEEPTPTATATTTSSSAEPTPTATATTTSLSAEPTPTATATTTSSSAESTPTATATTTSLSAEPTPTATATTTSLSAEPTPTATATTTSSSAESTPTATATTTSLSAEPTPTATATTTSSSAEPTGDSTWTYTDPESWSSSSSHEYTSSSSSSEAEKWTSSSSAAKETTSSDPYWYADRTSLKLAPTSTPAHKDENTRKASETSTAASPAATGNSNQPQRQSYPSTIVPSAAFVQPDGTTSIGVLFKDSMPWTWVVNQADLTAQIFGFMPSLISQTVEDQPSVTTVRLQQYNMNGSSTAEKARTLYVAYIPTSSITDLQALIRNSSSPFYLSQQGAAAELAGQVDPNFDILTAAGVTKGISTSSADQSSKDTKTLKYGLIGVGCSVGACAVLAIGYMYWKKKHQRKAAEVPDMQDRTVTINSFGLRETWAPTEVWGQAINDVPTEQYNVFGDNAAVLGDRASQTTERSGSDYSHLTESQRIQAEYEHSRRSYSPHQESYESFYQQSQPRTRRRRGSVASSIISRPEMTSNSMLL